MTTNIPGWVLAIFYWLHMMATILGVGGLSTLSLIVFPASRSIKDIALRVQFLGRVSKRIEVVGYFSIAILIFTGMFQLGANPNYDGFFAISNKWAQSILIKHVLVGGMVAVSIAQTWGILPEIQRALLRKLKTDNDEELLALQNREKWLVRLNMLLASCVLLMTAIARALNT